LRCLWRPVIASTAMFVLVFEICDFFRLTPAQHPALTLVTGILVGVFSYAILILVLWMAAGRPVGAESLLWRLVRSRLGRVIQARS
jgi:hypothetical protein